METKITKKQEQKYNQHKHLPHENMIDFDRFCMLTGLSRQQVFELDTKNGL